MTLISLLMCLLFGIFLAYKGYQKSVYLWYLRSFVRVHCDDMDIDFRKVREELNAPGLEAFHPMYSYKYCVNNEVYSGDGRGIKGYLKFYDQYEAQAFANKLKQSKSAFYDPHYPERSIPWQPSKWFVVNESGQLVSGILVVIASALLLPFVW